MPVSLLDKINRLPLVCIDTETTGASADLGHRVIEIGIVRCENGRAVAHYSQLIDPQRRISPGITAITGITNEMIAGQPTFAQQFEPMMAMLRGAILLGHNVRFDLSFLHKEFVRCGRDMQQYLDGMHVLDTLSMARKRFGRGGNALQRLAVRLDYQPSVAHRALADAITTAEVLTRLLGPVGGGECSLCDALAQQGGPIGLISDSARESLLPVELEEALELGRPVLMDYLDGSNQRTQRVILPQHIRRSNGELLLIAHCQLRNDRRTFKVERIVALTRIEESAKA